MMKDEADILSELADEFAARQRDDFVDRVQRLSKRCESPIERVFLCALEAEMPDDIAIFDDERPHTFDYIECFTNDHGTNYIGAIYPQCWVGEYRVDFYFEAFDKATHKTWFSAVIECDGHDFHEKTKEQARRDKRRDRWFQTRGIAVYRFAGSEIWSAPKACADQLWDAFLHAFRRHFRPGQAT
jgi:very-short-patch-repair endonuclease